ncbi:MAG TPA: L-lactate permease [Mycobacteriales bacterium]|jgi:lactate permease
MYRQVLDPVAGSLALTSLFAALPLVTLFLLLGVLRMKAWVASLVALAVAVGVAVLVYPMPVGQAFLAGTEGAAFGFFPILWIVLNAIWIYNMTVVTGHFDVLRRSMARVSDDMRIQGVIVAFCFGALLEALAGFGTPVAITSVMLIALGFRPLKAATVALVANTAPVAFGALGVPITTLASVSHLPEADLGAMVGRQTPFLAVLVPVALVFLIDGRRGVRQTLPATLVCGVSFALAQFATSNFVSIPLTDIVASLVSVAAMLVFLRVWSPAESYTEPPAVIDLREPAAARDTVLAAGAGPGQDRGVRTGGGDHVPDLGAGDAETYAARDTGTHDSRGDVGRAYAPYLIVIAVFVVAQIPPVKEAIDSVTHSFGWPGLHILTAKGDASSLPTFKLNWLDNGGSLLVIAGLLTVPVLGIGARRAFSAYLATYRQLATAIVTVMAVLALAYVMNASGQTTTLGAWMAGAGGAFALLSPVLGWLGVAVTGSDTSSNSLFGGLQVAAADPAGLKPVLLAAANSSGGVLGKMISPQNLAIAAAAVGITGREGDLFRRVFWWSAGFVVLMCLLVYLQATVLAWMVP